MSLKVTNRNISYEKLQNLTPPLTQVDKDKDNFMLIEESNYFKVASEETQNSLKGKGLLVSINPVTITKDNATYQNATNGMLNKEALAIKNAIDQTGSDIVTINYNPTHGFFGDVIESGTDKSGVLTSGIAKQTGEFIRDTTTARGTKGSNFAAHSQANILTKSGIEYINEISIDNPDLGFMDRDYFIDTTKTDEKDRERGIPTFKGYGSPVNTEDMKLIVEGEKGNKFNFTGMVTNPNDFVGEVIGNNIADNQSRGAETYIDILNPNTYKNAYLLFTGESPHSTYKCNPATDPTCGYRP